MNRIVLNDSSEAGKKTKKNNPLGNHIYLNETKELPKAQTVSNSGYAPRTAEETDQDVMDTAIQMTRERAAKQANAQQRNYQSIWPSSVEILPAVRRSDQPVRRQIENMPGIIGEEPQNAVKYLSDSRANAQRALVNSAVRQTIADTQLRQGQRDAKTLNDLQRAGATIGKTFTGTEKQWLGNQLAGIDALTSNLGGASTMTPKAQEEYWTPEREASRKAAWDYTSAVLDGTDSLRIENARKNLEKAVYDDWYLAEEYNDSMLDDEDVGGMIARQLESVANRMAKGDTSVNESNILDQIRGGNLQESVQKAFESDESFRESYENLIKSGEEDLQYAKDVNHLGGLGDWMVDAASSTLSSAQSQLVSRVLLAAPLGKLSSLQGKILDKLQAAGAAKAVLDGTKFVGDRIQDILGMSSFAVGAYGASTNEARQAILDQGLEIGLEEAKNIRKYAARKTNIELATEMLFSSVGAIRNASGDSIFPGFSDSFGNWFSSWSGTAKGSATLRTIGEKLGGGIEEGLEEVIGDALNDFLGTNRLIGNDEKTTIAEYVKDFSVGFMSGMMGEVMSPVYNTLGQQRVGQEVLNGNTDQSYEQLYELARDMAQENPNDFLSRSVGGTNYETLPMTQAFQAVESNGKGATAQNAGRLYQAYQQYLENVERGNDTADKVLQKVSDHKTITKTDLNQILQSDTAMGAISEATGTQFTGETTAEKRDEVRTALEALASEMQAADELAYKNALETINRAANGEFERSTEDRINLAMQENASMEADQILRNLANEMQDQRAIPQLNLNRSNILPSYQRGQTTGTAQNLNRVEAGQLRDLNAARTNYAALRDTVEQMNLGESGKDFILRNYDGQQNPIEYANAVDEAYQLGRVGAEFNSDLLKNTAIPYEVKRNAYIAGRNDYNGGISNAETGLRVRTGSERLNGQNTSGSAGILEEGAGRNQIRQARSFQRERSYARVSSQSISAGTIAKAGLKIVSDSTEPKVAAARKYAHDHGVNFVAWTGGALTIDGVQSRGFYDPKTNTIFVRADHQFFTAEQIAKHETTHSQIHNGEIKLGDVDGKEEAVSLKTVYDALREELGTDRFEELLDKYVEMYAGTDLSRQDVFEEMICDAVAGMNEFEAHGHFEESLRQKAALSAAKAVTEENAANGERAGTDAAESGKRSIDRKGNVVDDNFSEQRRNEILEDIYDGKYKAKDFSFTVLQHTPPVILENVDNEDRSFVAHAQKVKAVMDDHDLNPDSFLDALYRIYNPDYIVFETKGRHKDHHVAIAELENGDGVVAFELISYREGDNAVNGEVGYYNVVITAFEPNREGFVEDLFENGYVVYDKNEANKEYEIPEHVALNKRFSGLDTGISNKNVSDGSSPVKQNISSAGTSLNQVPALHKDSRIEWGDTNIDIGAGAYEAATEYLKAKGVTNLKWDPYNQSEAVNRSTLKYLQEGNKADTATCANVLNVIREKDARLNVILQAAKSIDSDGKAYFMVYEGDGSGKGKETSKGWQNNLKTREYADEIRTYFNDVQVKGKLIIASGVRTNLPKASWEVKPGTAIKYSMDTSAQGSFNNLFATLEDGRIKPNNVEDLSTEDWQLIYKAVKKLGYGIESAKQAKEVYSRYVGQGGFNKEQSDAIKKAYGVTEGENVAANPKREALARKTFGTTGDFREAGYLMRNGSMLDFSGKKDGGPAHVRYMDHREISSVFGEDEITEEKRRYGDNSAYMNAFISEGNIRLMDGQGVTIGEMEPTPQQYKILKQFVERILKNEDYFYLDLSNNDGYTVESRDYEGSDSADRIIRDIKSYYKNGELPYRSELSKFYSRDLDSDGNQLTKGQQEFFKDSKVRTEDGALKVMYQGSDNEFTVFDRKKSRSSNLYGRGFYFTDNENAAKTYGKTKPYYLNVVNPLSPGQDAITRSQMRKFLEAVYDDQDEYSFENYGENASVASVLKTLYGKGDFEMIQDVNATAIGDMVAAVELFNDVNGTEYDGLILPTETVVFSSAQAKNIDNENPTDNPDVRYSRDFSSTDLAEQNRELRKDLTELRQKLKQRTQSRDYWRGQTKVTQGRQLRQDDVNRLAKDLIRGNNSEADVEAVAKKLKALGEYILNVIEDQADSFYEDTRLKAYEVAHDILADAKVLRENGGESFYNDFRDRLKASPIYVAPSVRNDINPDGWNAIRSMMKGIGTVTADPKKGKTIDVVYHDLQAEFGEWLLPDSIITEAEQFNQILEVVETYRPLYENINSYDMAEAVEWTANNILTRIIGDEIRETDPTYADRMEKRLADQKMKSQEALRKVRENRDQREKALKEHYRQVAEERRERKIDSEARTRLLKIARRLNNKKLDRVTRSLLDQYIGEIDLVSKGILGRTVKELETLRDWYDNWVEEQKAELGEDFVPDTAIENRIKRLSKKRINDLTQEEVADLTTVLLSIEHQLRTQHEFIDSEERRDTYAAAMAFREDYQEGKSSTENAFARTILFGLSGKNKESGGDGLLTPERAMHRLGNYNDDDPGYKLGKELSAGQRKMLDYQMRANALFDKWLNDKTFIRSLAGKHAQWITVKGMVKGELKDVRITPAMRMSLYLHAKNEQNLNHIERGGVLIPNEAKYKKGEMNNAYKEGIGEKVTFSRYMIHEITSKMSEKEKAFADMAYWYFNNMSKDAINETSEKHKGWAIATVEKYFPIESSRDFLKADFGMLLPDGSVAGQGFLNERNVKSTNPIMLYDMNDVLTKSIAGHSRYYGLALPVQNLNKMMNVIMLGQEGSIRNMLLDEHVKYIDKMVRDVQTGAPGVGGLLSALRSNYAGGVLVLNGGVAVKQAASYPTAAAVLGYMPLVKALKDRNKKVDLNLIAKYTPLLWYRSKGYSTAELGDIGNRGGIASKVTSVKRLNWIQGVDVWTTTKLWTAAEYYVRDNNKALTYGTDAFYKAVAEVYNRVIEETQPNYTAMQRPGVLRSDNQLTRALNMFKTQPFQNANILIDAYGNMRAKARQNKANPTAENTKALKDARKTFARAVTSQALSAFTFALMQAIWDMARGKFKKYKDDDDEATFWSVNKQLLLNMVTSFGGMVPYGGTVLEFLESSVDDISKLLGGEAVFDQKFYGFSENSLEAANDLGNTTKSLLADVIKTFLGKQTGETSARNIVDGLSTLIHMSTGLPAPNVVKDMQVFGLNAWRFYERFNGGWDEKSRLMAEYASLRVTTDPAKYKSDYYSLLERAWKNEEAAYAEIYDQMIKEDAFATASNSAKANVDASIKQWGYVLLESAWRNNPAEFEFLREKMINLPGDPFATDTKSSAENIDAKVKEWKKEAAPQTGFYQSTLSSLQGSGLWDQASEKQKKSAMDLLMNIAIDSDDKAKEVISGGEGVGIDSTEYILYKLALSMANPDGGTANQSEAETAINMIPGLSEEEKAYLFSSTNKGWKTNPFSGVTRGGTMAQPAAPTEWYRLTEQGGAGRNRNITGTGSEPYIRGNGLTTNSLRNSLGTAFYNSVSKTDENGLELIGDRLNILQDRAKERLSFGGDYQDSEGAVERLVWAAGVLAENKGSDNWLINQLQENFYTVLADFYENEPDRKKVERLNKILWQMGF